MMAVRERAVKVMAAPERRVPCLDDFVGQSWSAWTERANLTASEGSDGGEYSKNGKKTTETMTLRKEDMSIFGNFPGHDDFYLVVCGHCSQVVKPQAFEKHCERRHGPLGKLYAHLRSTPPQQQRSRHGHTHPSHGASSWSGRNQSVGPLRASPQSPSTPPQFRHSKPPKDGVRHSPSNSGHSEPAVFKQPPPIEPTRSSPPPTHRDPPWPHGGPSPNRPSSVERPQSQRGEAASAPVASGHLRGPRTNKMISKKDCDLDKHCGVLDPERKKVCTRLLTCNIHSIHQRRKVQGRSKNFDQLVAELKMSSRARDRVSQAPESSAASTVSPEPPRDSPAPPPCRRPLTNSPAFRTPTMSEGLEEDKPHVEDGSTWPHSPLTQAHISGDESEGEGNDDLADWHSTPWHPKPAALCSFGSHSLGHGVFTFDRRLHHLRSAMSAMVENHLSAHFFSLLFQFCLCMTQGILLFSADGSPFCFKSRKWKVRLHWFFQAVLLVCGATGFGFMVASKNKKEHPHFTSWHSLLGVATMASTVLQAICGFFLLFPKLISTHSFPRLRLYHATCGLVAYLLATITVISAMFSDWFQALVKGTIWYIFLLLPLFPALVVMNQITSAFLPKKKITS